MSRQAITDATDRIKLDNGTILTIKSINYHTNGTCEVYFEEKDGEFFYNEKELDRLRLLRY